MKRNPHERLIQLWGQDTTQPVEWAPDVATWNAEWIPCVDTPRWNPDMRYRLAGRPDTQSPPRVCVIPEATVPVPLTEVPESGEVWVVDIRAHYRDGRSVAYTLNKGSGAEQAVENRLAFSSKEDADAVAAAMLARVYR